MRPSLSQSASAVMAPLAAGACLSAAVVALGRTGRWDTAVYVATIASVTSVLAALRDFGRDKDRHVAARAVTSLFGAGVSISALLLVLGIVGPDPGEELVRAAVAVLGAGAAPFVGLVLWRAFSLPSDARSGSRFLETAKVAGIAIAIAAGATASRRILGLVLEGAHADLAIAVFCAAAAALVEREARRREAD